MWYFRARRRHLSKASAGERDEDGAAPMILGGGAEMAAATQEKTLSFFKSFASYLREIIDLLFIHSWDSGSR